LHGLVLSVGVMGTAWGVADSLKPSDRRAPLAAWRSPDVVPMAVVEFPIDWKASWQETLDANAAEASWRQASAGNPATAPLVEQLVQLRRAWLLEQMIAHFPAAEAEVGPACRRISETYLALGDRTRAAHWLKRLAEESSDPLVRIEACSGILTIASAAESMPDAMVWGQSASEGIESVVASHAAAADGAAVAGARRQWCALLVAAGRAAEARRWLDRWSDGVAGPQWMPERAALLEAAGELGAASEIHAAAGDADRAEALRAKIQRPRIEMVGESMPRDLEIHWNALQDKRAGGKSVLEDPELVQQTLKLSAEAKTLWRASPSYGVQCWLAIDEMLRQIPSAEMKPFRRFQETAAAPLAAAIDVASDPTATDRLFRSYPWSASVHALLVDAGEVLLRSDRPGEAFRAFQQVVIHSDDPVLRDQANVGAWFAMTELLEPIDSLEAAMAAVPDDARLSWRDEQMPAAAVKQVMRGLLPASAVELPALKELPRTTVELPAVLAADVPAAKGPTAAAKGLGSLSVHHIEQSPEGTYFFGPRYVACCDPRTGAVRWLQAGNPALATGTAPAFFSYETMWPAGAWRPLSVGSRRAAAIGPRRAARPGETTVPRAVYHLMFHNLREGATQYDLAAFDASSGQVLWRTMARDEWRDLEPLSEPSAVDGRVYVVAWDRRTEPPSMVHLVCLDGESGSTLWKQPLGELTLLAREQKLALRSAAVTLHQGSAYVSTNCGVVCRCDMVDGTVEWLLAYPQVRESLRPAAQLRREGTPPLVIGERVFVAPRDCSGVIAIDRSVGRVLWEAPLAPADQIVGATATALVVRAGDELAALDPASGHENWVRSVGEPTGARAVLAGQDVIVPTSTGMLRIAAASGDTVEDLRLLQPPGSARAFLPDGTLLEARVAGVAVSPPKLAARDKPQVLPWSEDWVLNCPNPRLVVPVDGVASDRFCVLADRQLLCIGTAPTVGVAWQTVLKEGADSVGFHGDLVVVARGGMLTAIEAAGGATRWTLRLPFQPLLVGGDSRVLFAGSVGKTPKVASINSATGALNWVRWLGEEVGVGDASLGWIAFRGDTGNPPAFALYWHKVFCGADGWRPGEMTVDAVSGAVQRVQPFLRGEQGWPERIVFGDYGRAVVGQGPFPLRAYQSSFDHGTIAFLGAGNVARFVRSDTGADLAAGWNAVLDPADAGRYEGAAALFATAGRCYVKRPQDLVCYDNAGKRELGLKIPVAPGMLENRTVLEVREVGETVTVVSEEPGQPVRYDAGPFTLGGLKDSTGKGDVTIRWFSPGAQVHNGRAGLAEAGTSPVATLLDGNTKEHYREQTIAAAGLASLGWSKYDVFVYGMNGNITINGQDPQTCAGWDINDPKQRTTFIRGVNYAKFAGVSGDTFTVKGPESNFCALQVVDASQSSEAGRAAAGIGLNWTGGGIDLGPNDRVGAEVALAQWYNVRPDNGLTGGYQNDRLFADMFDRNTGAVLQSQAISVGPRDPLLPAHRREAAILPKAVVVSDAGHVFVFRGGGP
jgi:hypothetical protein